MAEQEWIEAKPVLTDTTNFEWVEGKPYVYAESEGGGEPPAAYKKKVILV